MHGNLGGDTPFIIHHCTTRISARRLDLPHHLHLSVTRLHLDDDTRSKPLTMEVDLAMAPLIHKPEGRDDQIRPPSHRHAAPSAPWPWVDISDGESSFYYSLVYPLTYTSRRRPPAAGLDSTPNPPPLWTRRFLSRLLVRIPTVLVSQLDRRPSEEEWDLQCYTRLSQE